MSRNFLPAILLLFYLILLLMCCAMCESATDENNAGTQQNALVLFNSETKFTNGGTGTQLYKSFTFPSFGYVGGLLVVFAQADNSDGKKCDIVEGYFKFESENDLTNKFETNADSQWTKQVVTKNNLDRCKGSPVTVVNENNIYVFFTSTETGGKNIKYEVISNKNGVDSNNGVTWDSASEDLKKLTEDLKDISSIASGGPGIVIDSTIVVPVWFTTKSNNQFNLKIINVSGNEPKTWNLVLNNFSEEGKHPALAKWDKKIIMMASDKKGYRKVYESSDMGKGWKEAVESISGVWGNTEKRGENEYGGKNGFITAEITIIDNIQKKVILVTQPAAQPVPQLAQKKDNYKLHLWMTDYKRVFDAGAISTDVEKTVSSTLLHEKENLFVAYETGKTDETTINVKLLKQQLATIKNVLKKWIEQDGKLLNSCFTDELTLKKNEQSCTPKISTDNLVGYLSGNFSGKSWGDEYWCVNATVTKESPTVTNVTNGLQFSGAGAGATWPVGAQGQNQRYHFANNGFTLVATVKIDSDANENKNSMLGVGLVGGSTGKNSIGLWCSNGKWIVINEKNIAEETAIEKECVKEGIYQVALILKENDFSVYIGKKTEGPTPDKSIAAEQSQSITHFYFGANTGAQESSAADKSHVTVTNVLLYNRPFEEDEIRNLKEYVKLPTNTKSPDDDENNIPQGDQQQPTPPPDPTGDENKEDTRSPSPSRTEDGGVGGGVRVFSLLLAVLCVSAPLLHL